MAINPENINIASELGIQRLEKVKRQKLYYPTHFRTFVVLLRGILAINVVLIILLLYLFITRPHEHCFVTSFDGKVTEISSMPLDQANLTTQQNYIPETIS